MDYILFNHDGSIKRRNLTDFIQKGNSGVNAIFVSVEGIGDDDIDVVYTCSANFQLPNLAQTIVLATPSPVKTTDENPIIIEHEKRSGWLIPIDAQVTPYEGIVKFSLYITNIVNNPNTILLTFNADLVINPATIQPDETTITVQQYNELLAYFAKKIDLNLENGDGDNSLEQTKSDDSVNYTNPHYPVDDYQVGAFGKDSVVLNGNSMANNEFTIACGRNTYAGGKRAFACGTKNAAVGNNSFVSGQENAATGVCSHAEGQYTLAGGYTAHSEGRYSEATGYCSHAGGEKCYATGDYSYAESRECTASGPVSHAEGYRCIAEGECSHAEGNQNTTTATAKQSHVGGLRSEVRTANSIVHGSDCLGRDNACAVFGLGNRSSGSAANGVLICGAYNSGNSTSVLEVGNGTGPNNRHNAFTVFSDAQQNVKIKVGNTELTETQLIALKALL